MIDYSHGAVLHEAVVRDFSSSLQLLRSFLTRSGLVEQEHLDALCQQAEQEMHEPSFRAIWFLITAFGQKV